MSGIQELNRRRGFLPAGKRLKRPPRLGDQFQFRATQIADGIVSGTIEGFEVELQLPSSVDPRLMREGDLLLGRVIKVDRAQKKMMLEWQDTVQGAIVALDPKPVPSEPSSVAPTTGAFSSTVPFRRSASLAPRLNP